jgi:hypothetical protein
MSKLPTTVGLNDDASDAIVEMTSKEDTDINEIFHHDIVSNQSRQDQTSQFILGFWLPYGHLLVDGCVLYLTMSKFYTRTSELEVFSMPMDMQPVKRISLH